MKMRYLLTASTHYFNEFKQAELMVEKKDGDALASFYEKNKGRITITGLYKNDRGASYKEYYNLEFKTQNRKAMHIIC